MVFEHHIDMVNIPDSILLDSDQTIATLKLDDGTEATLEVRGEVQVKFRDETYYSASEFPEELIERIKKNPGWWDCDDDIHIVFNNWFEIFYKDMSGVIDCEENTIDDLYESIASYVNECLEEDNENNMVIPCSLAEFKENDKNQVEIMY